MTTTLKIAAPGAATQIVLPQEVLDQLGLNVGDEIRVQSTADGLTVQQLHADSDHQMDVANKIIEKRADVLRRLAE